MIALPPAVMHGLAAMRCDAPKARVLLVADFSRRNSERRFWVLDMSNPARPEVVLRTLVAHGSGSDPGHTGWATRFSNTPDSEMSSLGAAHVAEQYVSHGTVRYRLDGESASDFLLRPRNVVLHVGEYVTATSTGWSEGCFAISAQAMQEMRQRFGSLTGAFLWSDGPGVQVPTCAANTAPWLMPVRACSVGYTWGAT